ncbi:MAG TPA: hypothetical protein VKY74_05170 [Chloroflexia bacterium]|nr:hypothetical protein [Chloroflexia bacterium]
MPDPAALPGHEQVAALHCQALDAYREGQYATMERLLEQAVAIAAGLDDLPLLVQEHYWLASAQRMQGQHQAALATYVWLIGLASTPATSRQLADTASLKCLVGAFIFFVDCGRFLPEMPVARLLEVVREGLAWLEQVGQPTWGAGLRLARGILLQGRQDWAGARREMEAALAMRRRDPAAPGPTLAAHLLQLAGLLNAEEVADYTTAAQLADEAWTVAHGPYARGWVCEELVNARLGQGDPAGAAAAAQEALAQARATESPSAMATAYKGLGRVYQAQERAGEAAVAAAQQWIWAHRDGCVEYRCMALVAGMRVRLLQARLALRGPATDQRAAAARRLRGAQRFLQQAEPLTAQLDQASGTHGERDRLAQLQQEHAALAAQLREGAKR